MDIQSDTFAPMAAHQLATAAETLSAAFADDPFFVYLFDNTERRKRWTTTFMRGGIALSPTVIVNDTTATGVIALYPPGSYPPAASHNFLYQLRMTWESLRCRMPLKRLLTIVRVLTAIDNAHPTEPCWYILELGVHPDSQGTGLGTRLMKHACNLADRDGRPTYLETTNHNNLAYYTRFGFCVQQVIEGTGEAPAVWTMLRPPATEVDASAGEV